MIILVGDRYPLGSLDKNNNQIRGWCGIVAHKALLTPYAIIIIIINSIPHTEA